MSRNPFEVLFDLGMVANGLLGWRLASESKIHGRRRRPKGGWVRSVAILIL